MCLLLFIAVYCPGTFHGDELQGRIFWNRTGATGSVEVDCPLGPCSTCGNGTTGIARRTCLFVNGRAQWDRANLSECRYADVLTEKINALQSVGVLEFGDAFLPFLRGLVPTCKFLNPPPCTSATYQSFLNSGVLLKFY